MNKFILLYKTQIRFDSSVYGKESIVPESRLLWVPVNTQVRLT